MNAESVPTAPSSDAAAVRREAALIAAPRQLPLDLEWEVSPGVPAIPAIPPLLHVVGGGTVVDPRLGDPTPWIARLARAVSEVIAGVRPAGQLTRHVTRPQLARIEARAAARRRHPAGRLRATPPPREVRGIRVCAVSPGIVEASAVLIGGERSQAIALRLESVDGRWLATVVDIR
jgi:hypothetical protein